MLEVPGNFTETLKNSPGRLVMVKLFVYVYTDLYCHIPDVQFPFIFAH